VHASSHRCDASWGRVTGSQSQCHWPHAAFRDVSVSRSGQAGSEARLSGRSSSPMYFCASEAVAWRMLLCRLWGWRVRIREVR